MSSCRLQVMISICGVLLHEGLDLLTLARVHQEEGLERTIGHGFVLWRRSKARVVLLVVVDPVLNVDHWIRDDGEHDGAGVTDGGWPVAEDVEHDLFALDSLALERRDERQRLLLVVDGAAPTGERRESRWRIAVEHDQVRLDEVACDLDASETDIGRSQGAHASLYHEFEQIAELLILLQCQQ